MFKPLLIATVLMTGVPTYVTTQMDYRIERAAREYRIEVYNSFRSNRPQYDRQLLVGQRTLDAWKTGGRQENEAVELLQWYEQAILAARAGSDRLPQSPEFVSNRQPNTLAAEPALAGTPAPAPVTPEPSIDQASSPQHVRPSGNEQSSTDASTKSAGTQVVRGLGRALLSSMGGDRSRADRPRTLAGSDQPTQQKAEPNINLDDLKARVDSFNPTVAAVTTVLSGDDPVSLDQLTMMVEEMEGLVSSYNQLQPYLTLQSLSESNRAYVGKLEPLQPALDRLRERIQEARGELAAPSASGDGANGDDAARLNQLWDRVQDLKL